MRRALLIAIMTLMAASSLRAGQVGSTLGKYSAAGAGVGALLGSAAATVPYLQSRQPYDFLTGAGIGMLGGAVVGYILGVIDLAGAKPEAQAQAGSLDGLNEGFNMALSPAQVSLAWKTTF